MTSQRAIVILKDARKIVSCVKYTCICNILYDMHGLPNDEFRFITKWFNNQKPSPTINPFFMSSDDISENNGFWWKIENREVRIEFLNHLIQKIYDNPKIITEPRLKQIC